jgi:ferredoxin
MLRVAIDGGRCTGHGMCVLGRPDVFAVGDDDEGHAVVVAALHDDREREGLERVAAGCPEGAITVENRGKDGHVVSHQ